MIFSRHHINLIITTVLLLFVSCKSIDYSQKKAQFIYKDALKMVKKFTKGKPVTDSNYDEKIKLLEDLSGIESYKSEGVRIFYEPTRGNYIDWKTWYKDNKNVIYWNEKKQRVEHRIEENERKRINAPRSSRSVGVSRPRGNIKR